MAQCSAGLLVESSAVLAECSLGTIVMGVGFAILTMAGVCYGAYKLYKFVKARN